jgi:hypothetical protein
MSMIRSTKITYTEEVPEADVRAALVREAYEKHCLVQADGKLIGGVEAKVTFDGRRGRGDGSYTITIIRDPAKSGQALIGSKANG